MSEILEPNPESSVLHMCEKPNIDKVQDGSFWKCPTCQRWWKADRKYPRVTNFYGNEWKKVKLTDVKDRLRIRKLLQDQEKNND